jgi:hypothetical protein
MPMPHNDTLRNANEKMVEVVLGAGAGGAMDFRRYIGVGDEVADAGDERELNDMLGVSAPVPHGVESSSRSDW